MTTRIAWRRLKSQKAREDYSSDSDFKGQPNIFPRHLAPKPPAPSQTLARCTVSTVKRPGALLSLGPDQPRDPGESPSLLAAPFLHKELDSDRLKI